MHASPGDTVIHHGLSLTNCFRLLRASLRSNCRQFRLGALSHEEWIGFDAAKVHDHLMAASHGYAEGPSSLAVGNESLGGDIKVRNRAARILQLRLISLAVAS